MTRTFGARMRAPLSPWQNDMALLADWYRET